MKHQFSVFSNEVSFDGRFLKIEGRVKLVSLLLLGFLLSLLYIYNENFPFLIKLGIGVTVFILGWGFVDVFFSQNRMRYDIKTKWLSIKRSSHNQSFSYEGDGSGLLKVTLKKTPNSNSDESYMVILYFENEQYVVPYLLESFDQSYERGGALSHAWREKLKL